MHLSTIKKQLLLPSVLSLAIIVLATDSSTAEAQQGKAKITGTVHMLTETIQLPKALEVQLIVLEETKQPSSVSSSVDKNGNFEFVVNSSEKYNYIPFLVYKGVRYFSDPQSIKFNNTSEAKKIHFNIYQSTSNHSSIIIEQTKVTLIGLQRSNSTLTLRREDSISQNNQYVYTGDESGNTIQIPLFSNTLNASAEGEYLSEFKIKGNYLNTQMPIRPGLNSVVTKHIVSYDKDKDYYSLNVKNIFPSNRILVEIPEDFVNKIEFEDNDSWRKKVIEINNIPLLSFSQDMYVKQNQNINITFIGLSGLNSPHIFTSTLNIALAICLSLILISAIATSLYRKNS